VIGDPIEHSLSPAMQTAAFDAARLAYRYEAIRVTGDGLSRGLEELRQTHAGVSVTAPLKVEAVRLVRGLSADAERAGSVNTIAFGAEPEGHSTDGGGFMAALSRAGVVQPNIAVVLGTGGAARAVAAALLEAGVRVVLAGRNDDAGRRLVGRLAPGEIAYARWDAVAAAIERSDVLVNATPAGSAWAPAASPLPPGATLRSGAAVFDLVSVPLRTPLLEHASAAGCVAIPGVEMLVEQGALSFELWTGLPAPVDVMRAAAYNALGSSDGSTVEGSRR
jgi:shikimate dehydrogenase